MFNINMYSSHTPGQLWIQRLRLEGANIMWHSVRPLGWGQFNVSKYLTIVSSLEEVAKVYIQTRWEGHGRISPLDPPRIRI